MISAVTNTRSESSRPANTRRRRKMESTQWDDTFGIPCARMKRSRYALWRCSSFTKSVRASAKSGSFVAREYASAQASAFGTFAELKLLNGMLDCATLGGRELVGVVPGHFAGILLVGQEME